MDEAALYLASSRIGGPDEGHLTSHLSIIHKAERQQRHTDSLYDSRDDQRVKANERGERGTFKSVNIIVAVKDVVQFWSLQFSECQSNL